MPEGVAVLLTEKPGKTSTFVEWEGGDCEGLVTPTCTVTMDAAEAITAVYSGTSKTITPAEALTLTKAGSGTGSVKASGLKCEVLCGSTTVLYQGPVIVPKPKAGKTVVLAGTAAPGSQPVVWSGDCDEVTVENKCVVTMEEAENVTATFDELE